MEKNDVNKLVEQAITYYGLTHGWSFCNFDSEIADLNVNLTKKFFYVGTC